MGRLVWSYRLGKIGIGNGRNGVSSIEHEPSKAVSIGKAFQNKVFISGLELQRWVRDTSEIPMAERYNVARQVLGLAKGLPDIHSTYSVSGDRLIPFTESLEDAGLVLGGGGKRKKSKTRSQKLEGVRIVLGTIPHYENPSKTLELTLHLKFEVQPPKSGGFTGTPAPGLPQRRPTRVSN